MVSKPTTTLSARGRSKKGRDQILRLFHGLPVRDAKRPLRVFPLASDIRGAKTKDPSNCVLARACKRMFGTRRILFWRSVAYVELPEGKQKYVERFVLNRTTRKGITDFDSSGKADPDGYTLNPPAKGQTLEYRRRYQADWIRRPRIPNKRKRILRAGRFEIRDGHGQVHFERKRA